MPRRKRPDPDPPLTLPPEEESLEDLIDRAGRIRRASESLIRQMRELEGQIAEVKARRQDRGKPR